MNPIKAVYQNDEGIYEVHILQFINRNNDVKAVISFQGKIAIVDTSGLVIAEQFVNDEKLIKRGE